MKGRIAKWEVLAALILVATAFSLVLLFFVVQFHGAKLSSSPGDWGVVGDYFGGLLNPVTSMFALYFLIRAYMVQRTELAETKAALADSATAQQEMARLQALHSNILSSTGRFQAQAALLDNFHKEIIFRMHEVDRLTTAITTNMKFYSVEGNEITYLDEMKKYRQTLLEGVRELQDKAEKLSSELEDELN